VTDDDTFFSKEMLFDGLEILLETIRLQPGFMHNAGIIRNPANLPTALPRA
jgi:hypothetical protein